jgi:hypothetical protein
MHRAARLLHSPSHVLEERGAVGISVHRQALSKPHHVLRRVQTLLDGQARADWWCPWQRAIMAPVLVSRRPTVKEVS